MPRAKKGDRVRCISYDYSFYPFGSVTEVLDVGHTGPGNDVIKLANTESPLGYSWYLTRNFQFLERSIKQETTPMAAYEKTKYFAVKLQDLEGASFLHMDPSGQTVLRDSKSEVLSDIKSNIVQGERWVVLQTIAMVTPEDPRPPIKVIEYR